VCRDLAAGHHAEREEALAELPVAVNEEPDERAVAAAAASASQPDPEPAGASATRRWGSSLFGVFILFILRRAGARPRRGGETSSRR
jgi:hypothetical protein